MELKKIIIVANILLASSMALAESAPVAVDLCKLYGQYEQAGYSSLELMEKSKRVLISGVALDVSQSMSGDSILKVGCRANSQAVARLAAAADAQKDKLNSFRAGAKFKAVCELAFSSGTQYMSLQGCVFQ